MKKIFCSTSVAIAALIVLTFVLAPAGRAATVTWTNTGTDFNTAGNWTGGTGVPGLTDVVTFTGAKVTDADLSAPVTVLGINFAADASGGYTLGSANGSALGITTSISNLFAGTNTISANIVFSAGTRAVNQAAGGSLVLSGNITETGGAVALSLSRSTGTPIYTLSGNNNFSGGVSFSSSSVRLNINSATALGTGALTLGNNSGSIDNTSGAAIILTNNNRLNLSSASGAGVTFVGSNDLSFGTGAVVLSGNALQTITVSANTLTLGGVISESGGVRGLSKLGAGTLAVTGNASTYTGATSVGGGVMAVSALANGGVASSIGASSNAASNLSIQNGGTLRYIGSGSTTDRLFQMNNGGLGSAIDSSGTGALVFDNTGAIVHTGTQNAARTLILTGTNSGNNRMGALIGNTGTAGGNTNLVKDGTGKWIVSGNNAYSGTTNVKAGVLLVEGDQSAATGAVTVQNGATLGGSGIVGGATTAVAGSFLTGGDLGVAGNLSFASSLNISGLAGGTGGLLFDLGSIGAGSDLISLSSGILTIGSGVLDFSDFNFAALSGFGAGTYTLFDTTQNISGTLGTNLTGTIGSYDVELAFADNNHDLVLVVTGVPEPSTYAMLLSGAMLLFFFQRAHRRKNAGN